jgi:hypothetical protein
MPNRLPISPPTILSGENILVFPQSEGIYEPMKPKTVIDPHSKVLFIT